MITALYACLYVREFPALAMLRLRPHLKNIPVVILEGTPPRQTTCSRNARAAALGIEPGTTRAELDVFPGVTHLPRSLAEESSARAALLQCSGRFSPRVECLTADPTPANASDKISVASDTYSFVAILDIAGTEKLLGPPEQLAKKLLQSIRTLGMQASVVVSVNIDAALCLARSLGPRPAAAANSSPLSGWTTALIPAGEEATALASLPLSVLPLTPEHAETFARWGISTLGALAALPEKELIARLGQQGLRLRQLAQGVAPHLLVPSSSPLILEERIELDSPVELLDSLLFVLGVLLDHLLFRATAQILALASVTVTLALEGSNTHTRTVRPALPGNDRRLWLKLLHLDLQAHPPSAAILAITLAADPGSTSKVQLGLFSPQLPEPSRLDVTLARIRAIVGPAQGDARVGRAVLEDTHRPDTFRIEPFTVPTTTTAAPAAPVPQAQARTAARRLRPPEPITVTLHQRRPTSFVFRNQRYTVERAWGPWFFSGNWWGIECWSIEKWDLIARSDRDSAILSCAIARNPHPSAPKPVPPGTPTSLHPAPFHNWRIEELYD